MMVDDGLEVPDDAVSVPGPAVHGGWQRPVADGGDLSANLKQLPGGPP